jgi:hypothetical protein
MRINEVLKEIETAYPEDIFPGLTKEEIRFFSREFPGIIDRASASMGRHLAKVIREKIKKETEWRERYKARLIVRGYSNGEAIESSEAAEYDEDLSPEEAADNELELWEEE